MDFGEFLENNKVIAGIILAAILAFALSGIGSAIDHEEYPRIYSEQDLSE